MGKEIGRKIYVYTHIFVIYIHARIYIYIDI